ncbi:S8 family serine peptidase [Bacillus cereus]|nr:S8 family serine peptidase [Bacillus cereus]
MIKKKILYSLIFLVCVFTICAVYFFFFQRTGLVKINQSDNLALLEKSKKEQVRSWALSNFNSEYSEFKSRSKIKVAILDSGIEKQHDDLKNLVIKEYNVIEPQHPVIDVLGHGTTVAGIIAAHNNKIGITGVAASLVELYDVKVLDDDGKGKIDNLVQGINWSVENNVDVLNISFGMSSNHPELERVIEKAIQKGKIDFAAPGVNVITTTTSNGYSIENGTSLATAHVTGIVSLILANKETFKLSSSKVKFPKEVYKILEKNTVDIGGSNQIGNGFIKL